MKIGRSIITYIIPLALVFAFVAGCADSKERNIIGVWEMVPLTTLSDTTKWSFFDGGVLYIEINNVITDSADYVVSSNVIEYFVDIEGLYNPDENDYSNCKDGRYKIDQLKSDVLKLQRISNGDGSTDAAFLYYEFIRSQ